MKFLERYVRPFAEYCVRTPLSEEKLVRALRAELPAEGALFSGKYWKAFFGFCDTFIIRERKDPLVLFPMLRGRLNLWRTWVHIRCEKTESSPGTLLHITLAPDRRLKWFSFAWLGFALLWGIVALCSGFRLALLAVPFAMGFFFLISEICRSMAEGEIPRIRRNFEELLRTLEEKYAASK
ncbi:MAG: hypothetical protein J6331_10480 [Lentisphaeria bacterium]|nr:hypothetical protein [Lentisphaeria bacterium]